MDSTSEAVARRTEVLRLGLRVPSLLVLALFLAGCFQQSGSAISVGRWIGQASAPGTPTVFLDLREVPRGYLATITVPSERLLSSAPAQLLEDGRSLTFTIPSANEPLTFRGSLNGEVLSGTITKGRAGFSLALRHAGPPPEPPYREEAISFRNQETVLTGSLLLPSSPGPHPAVLMLHGSSDGSRNGLRFFADAFARAGMAAVIFDKRPTPPDDSGDHRTDVRLLASDAVAGIKMLQGRHDVDGSRVGLWGFSQGGWVAPIAAADNQSVAFLITLSAAGVSYAEQVKYANAVRLRSRGFSEAEVREAMSVMSALDDHVRGKVSPQQIRDVLASAAAARWSPHVNLPRKPPSAFERATSVRWRNLDLDPVGYWSRVRAPVLLIYGARDDAVPVEPSIAAIRTALGRSGNRNITARVFEQADHELRPAPELITTMLAWLQQHQMLPSR